MDQERDILDHYTLHTPYPTAWPADKIDNDPSDEEDDGLQTIEAQPRQRTKNNNRSTRRYTTLERRPGTGVGQNVAQVKKGSVDAAVQKDEADPLGSSSSVIQVLAQRGLPVENDADLRNKFLLSSTTFNPTLYLSEVHKNASNDALLHGLNTLSQSIEQKSASLKVLVETHFERFVRAKATIDNVYTEMRNHGAEPEPPRKAHSRQGSRHQAHLRSASAQSAQPPQMNEKRKLALIKESEFGTLGLKTPLLDATAKANDVWGPSLGGQEREDNLKKIMTSLDKNKNILDTGCAIEDCIKRRDYETLADEYGRAQRYAKEAKSIADKARQSGTQINEAQMHQIVITARVWQDISNRIDDFKRDTWKRLTDLNFGKSRDVSDGRPEEFMELIGVLLQLGVEENPIWVWLLNRWDFLKDEVTRRFEAARVQLEIMRRKIGRSPKPSTIASGKQLRTALSSKRKDDTSELDTRPIMEFWNTEQAFLKSLLSTKEGILGEVMEFWEIIQSFIDGVRQRNLPVGIDGQSRHHHNLRPEQQRDLQDGAVQLFDMIREQLSLWFTEAPIEDIGSMFTATVASRVNLDVKDLPAPIQAAPTNDTRENAAFWPPHSNSVSASTYLQMLVNVIGRAASEIAAIPLIKQDGRVTPQLRTLVNEVRERSLLCIREAWLADANNCGELEDWVRISGVDLTTLAPGTNTAKSEITHLPGRYSMFEERLISNLQSIVYVTEAVNSSESADVISPPPARHIETVQKAFRNSLYKALTDVLEHMKRSNASHAEPVPGDEEGLTRSTASAAANGATSEKGFTPGARKLMTITNLNFLKAETVPALVRTFEAAFTTTEEQKPYLDVLRQLRDQTFSSYVRPTVEALKRITHAGITDPSYGVPVTTMADSTGSQWRPSDARPYVYEALLQLVVVHTEVSRSAPSLLSLILQHLHEQLMYALIEAIKTRPKYTLAALMQATLDTEIAGQTLGSFTSEKAKSVQDDIYRELDTRTDNQARLKLHSGLSEMGAQIRRLREKMQGEFACFKRPKSHKGEKGTERDRKGAGGGGVGTPTGPMY